LLVGSPARAFHTVFDYQVDRVAVDGGAYGPADGVADFVDEFDDGVLAPGFKVNAGTARESDGVLHLTNPGTHIPFGSGIDLSEVENTVVLHEGGGDFTITSDWVGGVRDQDFVNLALVVTGGSAAGGAEFFGGALYNFGSELSLQVYRGEGFSRTEGDIHSVDAALADGPFSMRLSFDDDTDTATVSFSFDGGATFESFFDPIVIFRDRTDAIFVVGADPVAAIADHCCADNCTTIIDADADGVCDALDNCPALAGASSEDLDGDGIGDACDSCIPPDAGITWVAGRTMTVGFGDSKKLRLRADVRLPAGVVLDPVASGLRVQLRNAHVAPVAVVDLVVPAGALDANGAGWSADETASRFTFADGGHGPRDGIRRAVVRRRTDGTVRVLIIAPRGPVPTPFLDVGLAFPGMPGGCTDHAFASGACEHRGHAKIVCRDAPASP
jgi:hypothetical protein